MVSDSPRIIIRQVLNMFPQQSIETSAISDFDISIAA